jgi:hypothetical protein
MEDGTLMLQADRDIKSTEDKVYSILFQLNFIIDKTSLKQSLSSSKER